MTEWLSEEGMVEAVVLAWKVARTLFGVDTEHADLSPILSRLDK